MDDPEEDDPQEDGERPVDDQGEGLDLGPDRDQLFALKGGVQEYPPRR